MSRLLLPRRLLTACSLLLLAACCHGTKERGTRWDPEFPYPLTAAPKVGEIVHIPTGIKVSLEQMLGIAADVRVVYLGETHDNPASHRLELDVLRGLSERHPKDQALAMEMFSRSQQPILDRWVKGELTEKEFLKQVKWYETWQSNFAYYRDILNYARDHQIPVVALNAEKSTMAALRGKTPEELTPKERGALPEMDLSDPYQRAMVTAIFSDHLKDGLKVDGFLRAQTIWDETMAESVAKYLETAPGSKTHILVLAGGNHVSYGFGIPRRVFRRIPASYLLIGGHEIRLAQNMEGRTMQVEFPHFPMVPYNFLAFLAYEDLPERGVRLGVGTEALQNAGGLLVKQVEKGSNAEASGIQVGDVLVAMDGAPLTESFDLFYAVQQKHPGDHTLIRLKRKDEQKEIDVPFRNPPGKGAK